MTAADERRTPASTYRLQITADFDLFEATRWLPYLHRLGVDWVYLSPLLAAEPGSSHGYDVVAFDHVDEARGGAAGLEALATEARRLGMGVLVDIVPNHVGVAIPAENAWWWDVLTHGPDSAYAKAFDIDWAFGNGRVRIPVLADDDLPDEDGAIGNLDVVDGELRYHGHRFPLAPGTADDLGPDGADPSAVHARQHYELVSWRRADDELNYRRFFAVNTLAGIRVEDPDVLDATHAEVVRWVRDGLVDGLRIDHPDGLRDPRRYLDDLARLTGAPYVVVEKILERGEELPVSWATAGTTGYDALALIDRVLVDPAGEPALTALETRLRGAEPSWPDEVHDRKLEVATGTLRSETRRIVRELPPDVPVPADRLEQAVAELLACFGVYRSYLPEGHEHLDAAFRDAERRQPALAAAYAALRPVLADPDAPAARRFQQTSGMVMAKGVEDCAFYRHSRLTCLNEVGGDPSWFALAPEEFHDAMAHRQAVWPHAMTALSTHDTKRGEDVRARLAVLAEVPDVWEQSLGRLLAQVPLPDPVFGSLLWQAVVGVWPAGRDSDDDLRPRLHAYAEKAMREAGTHTTWTAPDETYEKAVHDAVDAAFADPAARAVLDDLVATIAPPGWSNGLVAKVLAITAPGVCDVYQGSELWEQSLVDPDNRRPVDFGGREHLLTALDSAPPTGGLGEGGVAKLWAVSRALRLRRDRRDLFTTYAPVVASGPAAAHLVGFDRGGALTLATRLPVGLEQAGGWGDTVVHLPPGRWHDLLAPGTDPVAGDVRVADLLDTLPVALLVAEEDA